MLQLSWNTSSLCKRVRSFERGLNSRSDGELRDLGLELRFRCQGGESFRKLLPQAFALVCESAHRNLGYRPHDVQVLGAIKMAHEQIIEMETGQGKTLTATMPLFLYALRGEGAHLATSNGYLAQRDSETMSPVFDMIGATTGHISESMSPEVRREQYACDITYGSATEFGFDFLRDRMQRREKLESGASSNSCMRDLFYVLADEADAVMIDEANTPLIIGANGRLDSSNAMLIQWASSIAHLAQRDSHFRYNVRQKTVELTKEGRNWIRTLAKPIELQGISVLEQYRRVEIAIQVHRDFHRDQHYIVRNDEVVLVNEGTGRLGEGRQWQDGIHQAIQASENLELTAPSTHAAKITIQGLFLSYKHLAGMTGTASSASTEFRKVYRRSVATIPPHQRSQRMMRETLYFGADTEKWNAIADEIATCHASGQPVLVGTRSVEKSVHLSQILRGRGIPHELLNAREESREAEIIAKAGEPSAVTVATGMAGRGTDIKLGPGVEKLGGLYVLLTELHESPRMDQQLFGRCGRQGDPGSFRQYLSLDDAILDLAYGEESAARTRLANRNSGGPDLLKRAQDKLAARKRGNRFASLYQEKRRLRSLWQLGSDPLLDAV